MKTQKIPELARYCDESPLTREELQLLETLVKSPVFSILKKIASLHRGKVMSELVSITDERRIAVLQGQVQGLNLCENLPAIFAKMSEEISKKETDKKSAKSA